MPFSPIDQVFALGVSKMPTDPFRTGRRRQTPVPTAASGHRRVDRDRSSRVGAGCDVRRSINAAALGGNNPVRPSSQFARYVRGEFEMGAGLNRCLILPIVTTGSCAC
jgi:hypothetical protein